MDRDRAVGAAVVTAVPDAQISEKAGGRLQPVAFQAPAVLGGKPDGSLPAHHPAHRLHNIPVGAEAQHAVAFGQLGHQFLLVPLGQAAGDDDALNPPLLFQLGEFQNILDGFLFGVLDEAAGVDNHHVRQAAFRHQFKAGLLQLGQHQFRIHLVLRAAERYHSHFTCHRLYSTFLLSRQFPLSS